MSADIKSEVMQVQKIIVIHPGSQNLRIGRASDLNPVTILHAIGRKCLSQNRCDGRYHDTLLPPLQKDYSPAEFEEQRLHVSHIIQSRGNNCDERGGKKSRTFAATPPQQIATYNRRSVPEELHHEDTATIKTESPNNDTNPIFDEQLLRLTTEETLNYNIHFPFRHGELHLHCGLGGSMTSVLADLESIWLYAIENRMKIPSSTLVQYSAVLCISDVYNRSHLRELMALLLQRLKFRSCFLVQDHVAATFGGGLGYACVVDVGHQKCSVSCVEDSISQPDTRVRLGYGGGDITQVFYMLLRKCSFPYKECDVESSYADASKINELKERFCHVNLEVCGAQEKVFEVKSRQKHLRYTIQLGDECIVAPLAFFHTELMNITGKQKSVRVQLSSNQQPDAEDCFDAEYIRETGRRNGRDQLLEGSLPVVGEVGEDDLVGVDTYDVERDANNKNSDNEDWCNSNGQILALDQAIIRSIERCPSEEMKRKMFSCILLVGSSVKFPGFSKWLEQKVKKQLSANTSIRSSEQSYEVNVYTKEMDAGMIAWKGAAIMSCLESAPELWIYRGEWEKYGLRILREKAPFIW